MALQENDPALCGDDHVNVIRRQHADDTAILGALSTLLQPLEPPKLIILRDVLEDLSSLHTTAHPPIAEAGEACGVNDGDEMVRIERTRGIPTDSIGAHQEGNIASPLDERLTMHMKPPLPPGAVNTTRITGPPQVAKKRWFRGSICWDPLLGALEPYICTIVVNRKSLE
ncbi:hypothetical protein HK102_010900 [Quaeritorhiza haematococci]|nr:hypothetical protein HK102_010900 [Quaeritorhiza haematococci]